VKQPKIVYAKGWSLKPFKHGRPFVRLEDYKELLREKQK
jgi:hypothetical protein